MNAAWMIGETTRCHQHHKFAMITGNMSEWLETDGLGGFASGTVSGIRTRRYHGILLVATTPPTGRMMLVNGLEVWVTTSNGRWALSTHWYQPGVQYPDGASHLTSFALDPWPTWTWTLPDGERIIGELFAVHGSPRVVTTWRIELDRIDDAGRGRTATLEVRPLMSGRDYHSLHRENGAFRFEPQMSNGSLAWQPYEGMPAVRCVTNGVYRQDPQWFRNFLYLIERERGLDDTEDLASPGVLTFDLHREAMCVWNAAATGTAPVREVEDLVGELRGEERSRRAGFAAPLTRAADQFLVTRGSGRTIVAGYPWFTDWGRDTFIAIRGLCFATGRLTEARDILLEWTGVVSQGMLPNRFPDGGSEPEYNAVDASLWFVIAAGELLEVDGRSRLLTPSERARLRDAVVAILEGYSRGTRYGIHMDGDGLIAAGERGQQLTWMDARVDGREITPRIGKPVEVQALWLNALKVASAFDARWRAVLVRGMSAFSDRFWNPTRGFLFDVVDVNHCPGVDDPTLRPNQVLAVGGLPLPIVSGERARLVVEALEKRLWTPLGLRSLAPTEPGYVRHYIGGPAERDSGYHQGTVWPWLIGAFVDGWLRVRDSNDANRAEAHARFVAPLEAHLGTAGLGHASEIADAEPPFSPRGCPFQAWSLGELIRARHICGVSQSALMSHGERTVAV
jgi:predicted glycogen debranching enzyme